MSAGNKIAEKRQELSVPDGAKRVGVHVCCAVCAAEPLEALLEADIQPVVFFYNPNMDTPDEYHKRREETRRYADRKGVECVEVEYEPEPWRLATHGLESEPEWGRRCEACFLLRLRRAAQFCAERGLRVLATTLGISRYKNLDQVNHAGMAAASLVSGVTFWPVNWRRQGGEQRTDFIARREGMYRQNFCGCVYSRRPRQKGDKI